MKENCLLVFINAPMAEEMPPRLTEGFGESKLVPAYTDMARHFFAAVKKLHGIQPTAVYKNIGKYPDLRWLDPEDPGFLSLKGATEAEQAACAARWAFDAGAKRVALATVNAPALPANIIENCFSLLAEKDMVAGADKDGDLYLLGMNKPLFSILEGYPWPGRRVCDEIADRAKRLRLNLHLLPEYPIIKDEAAYHQWVAGGRKSHSPARQDAKPAPAAGPR
ncbi:MAG: DUF2064 domain-containing protein [Elusimicrobiales bacterium]